MLRRFVLSIFFTMYFACCSMNCTSLALAEPTLYSPANGAYVNGSQITFTWSPLNIPTCVYDLFINTASDYSSATLYDTFFNTTSTEQYPNFTNNGITYYWYIKAICIDPYANMYSFFSSIQSFTTFDKATSLTKTFDPASPVYEGDKVILTARGGGAPLGDYLYRFSEVTFIDNVYSSERVLLPPSPISSYTWTAPNYDAHKAYSLVMQVGTNSEKQVSGAFLFDILAFANYQVLKSIPLAITTDSLPDATCRIPYRTTLNATGGTPPYNWSFSPESITGLPIGLSLGSDGVISGIPTVWGSGFNFIIKVTDSQIPTPVTATKQLTMIAFPSLYIAADTMLCGTIGAPYNQVLSASGGNGHYNWSLNSGTLPPGLSLSSSGVISGTPSGAGNYTFTVKVSDSQSPPITATAQIAIAVYPPISITTASLPDTTANSAYNRTLTATGGNGNYFWSLYSGTLPTGLTLSSGGVVSGTPLSPGNFTFTVRVSDSQNPAATAIQQYTVTVACAPIAITTTTLASGATGKAYSQSLAATGGNGTYTWSLYSGSLPQGLTLSSNGTISGTPTVVGSSSFSVLVSDNQSPPATTIKQFTISISAPMVITTATLANGVSGTAYSQTMTATGGNGSYVWSVSSGSLPAGLSINATHGVIGGILNDAGSFTFTVRVTDTQGTPAATATFTISVVNGTMQHSAEYPSVLNCVHSYWNPFGSTANVAAGILAHDQVLFDTNGAAAFGTSISLFYKSQPAYNGPLGIGWSHTYDIFLTVNTDGSVVLRDGGGGKSYYTRSGSSYISPPGDFSTLVKNTDGTYVISYRDGHSYHFDGSGKVTALVDRFSNTITFGYSNGDLTSITDPAQRTTTIVYDQNTTPHRIKMISDPNGAIYDFSYQGNNLYRVTNPAATTGVEGGYWEYQYYPDGPLKTKRDPNNNITQYSYYDDQRLQTSIDPEGIVDPAGHTRTLTYPTTSDTMRTTVLTEKDGGPWSYTYDVQNGIIKEKADPLGNVTTFYYYPNGFVKAKTEPKDGTVRLTTFYGYDSYGNLLIETEPADLAGYSPAIDPELVTDPATLAVKSPPIKAARHYTYDAANHDRITSVSDERVTPYLTTAFTYATENGGEVVTSTATPGNFVTITKKNPNGTIKEIIDANQKSTTFSYYPDTPDNRSAGIVGLLRTTTDPGGITTTVNSYDRNGNPKDVKVTDKNGIDVPVSVTMIYDALSRLTSATKHSTKTTDIVTTYGYDNMENMTSLIDAEHHQTSYRYNYNRQITRITDARRNDTIFTYSGSGCGSCGAGVDKLIGIYDANVTKKIPLESQPHTAYQYDQAGRLERETDPLGKVIRYTHYDNGLVKEKIDASAAPEKILVTYIYSNRGELTDKNYSDGTGDHYTYTPGGQLETATNQHVSYRYDYYDDGRLHTVTDTTNNRVISYDQYDDLGQRRQVTLLKGGGADERTILYDYDTANRPWHITSSAGTFTYSYDSLGRRDTLSYPNGTLADWDFDDLNRLTAVSHGISGGGTFAAFSYPQHDLVGNRKSVAGSRNETYGYDELYRLLGITSAKPETFTLDEVGNRQNGPNVTDAAYQYNVANQMTQGMRLSYRYDNNGNQTARNVAGAPDKGQTLTWDDDNRLVRVEKVKGTERRVVSFKYDPLGRRIEKKFEQTVDDVTETEITTYVYDNEDIVLEYYTTATGAEKTFYTHGPGIDEPLGLERNGQFYYYHADGQGSITHITTAAKTVVQSYDYESYGRQTASTDFRNSITYTGREWDWETGTYYFRKRTYDPMDGIFTSRDPISFAGGDVNLYRFVQNNPVNFVDPFGLDLTPAQQAAVQTVAQDWANSNVPYIWGGSTKKGADCSGSVSGIYKQAGIDIGRMTSQGFKNSPLFSPSQGAPQIGDVGVYPGHVVIYGGNTDPADGRKNVWSASHAGGPVFGPANSSWFGKPKWYRYNGN